MSNSATWPPSATMRRATARPSPETPPVTTARIGEDGMGGPGSKARILARRVGGGSAAPTTGPVSGAIRAQQAAREFVGVQAGREQEALADRHAEFEHEAPLRLRFDAFGHQPQPQAAGDADHRLADRDVGVVVRHARDEQLAELEAVDRE